MILTLQERILTVVDLGTIIDEGLDIFIGKLQEKEALAPNDYNMIVTPKEIDELIENMKDVIARRNKLCCIKMKMEMIDRKRIISIT